MKSFIFVSFAFLAWAFYELSGGADFQPPVREVVEAPEPITLADLTPAAPRQPDTQKTPEVTRVATDQVAPPAAAIQPAVYAAPTTRADDNQPLKATLVSLEQSSTAFAQPLVFFNDESESTDTAPAAQADIRRVTGSRVNLREGPGTDFAVLTRLVRGDTVEIILDPGDGWVKLQPVDGGQVGWMSASLMRPVTD